MESSQPVIAQPSSPRGRTRELTVSGYDLIEGGTYSNDYREVYNGAIVEESPSTPADQGPICDRVAISGNKVIKGGMFGNNIKIYKKAPEPNDSPAASAATSQMMWIQQFMASRSALGGGRPVAEPNLITDDVPTMELEGLAQKLTQEQLLEWLLNERFSLA